MAKRLDGSVRKKTLGRRGGSMAGAQVGNIETSRDVLERYLQRAIKHPLLWEKVGGLPALRCTCPPAHEPCSSQSHRARAGG